MRIFLSLTAILAWVFGALLLLMPEKFYAPTDITRTPVLGTLAQAHGATLIGLGVINWLARKADKKGLVAVLGGNLVVQLLSLLVVLRTLQFNAGAAVGGDAENHRPYHSGEPVCVFPAEDADALSARVGGGNYLVSFCPVIFRVCSFPWLPL